MALRHLLPPSLPHFLLLTRLHSATTTTVSSDPTIPSIVNEICRILSDFRSPHDDIDTALSPFSSSISPAAGEQILKRCRHLPSPSHRFFLWSSSLPHFHHTPSSCNLVLNLLLSSRLFPLAWSLLSDFRPQFSNPASFRLLFLAYSRASLPEDAVRAFRRMPDFGVPPDLEDLHNLISSLSRYNHMIQAELFFNQSKSQFQVTQKTYTLLMNGWASIGKPRESARLFQEMITQGLSVDIAACNSLMAAYCKGGEVDAARKLFQEMKTLHGIVPNAASYGVFIRSCCESKDVDSAMRILHRMKMSDQTPNVFTYNAIIKLCCENRKVEDAYQLLDEMLERGAKPDTWSYNAILSVHCKLREVNMAMKLLGRMDRDSCLPDRHTYNMLLKMLIAVGRFDRVSEIWDSMDGRGFFPSVSTYAVMVHGLCRKKGKIDVACRYFEMMVEDGIPPYLDTCEVLRGELRRLGLGARIEVLADKMRRSTSCNIQELSKAMDGA